MSEPLIETIGLQKRYGPRLALDAGELVFERGHVYALLGANGSGKSTLLRLLAGMIAPDAGRIIHHGLDERGDIAYLPQKPYVFSFSVRRNLQIAMPDNMKRPEREALAGELLQTIGLEKLGRAKGHRLSGGEAQRLALGRMLAREHKLLLLDEPTSATDIAGNELIESALTAYLRHTGAVLIFATHALSQAERLADRAIFLHEGLPVEQGETASVLQSPVSGECRAFLRFWQG